MRAGACRAALASRQFAWLFVFFVHLFLIGKKKGRKRGREGERREREERREGGVRGEKGISAEGREVPAGKARPLSAVGGALLSRLAARSPGQSSPQSPSSHLGARGSLPMSAGLGELRWGWCCPGLLVEPLSTEDVLVYPGGSRAHSTALPCGLC